MENVSKKYSKSVKVGTEKYIKDNGKEGTRNIMETVYANALIKTKRADAFVGGSYKVLDVKTGQILQSGNATGTDSWSVSWITKATGDSRALPALPRKEPNYPSFDSMINTSSNSVANQIYNKLLGYAQKVGR